MNQPTCNARNEEVVVNEELHNRVELFATPVEHSVEFLGLGHGTRETIQHEAKGEIDYASASCSNLMQRRDGKHLGRNDCFHQSRGKKALVLVTRNSMAALVGF